ncbi:MAG: response regulator, partial [Deltaproteobacteria bacterium]|nr:response regulator [Deltaproteobacteria bacterium]
MEPGEDGGRVKAANEAVLIVEDDAPVRNLLKTILEAEGYPWDAAGDAAEARNRLAEKEYALVLTDINMPGESG